MSKDDRVLVVARSPQAMMKLEGLLAPGYQIATALSWEGASDLVDDFDPHMIVVDEDQNRIRSIEFVRKTKDLWVESSHLAILLLLKHQPAEQDELLQQSGADLIIQADCSDSELLIAVAMTLKLKKKEDEIISLYRKISVNQGIVKEMQSVDSITKLYNLPTITKHLEDAYRKARRFDEPMSVVLSSIDHFVHHSHAYGPIFCMQIIQQVSNILSEHVRGEDLLGRGWGGEFIAVLPETECEGAILVANRMREKIQIADFGTDERRLNLTISQGIASYNPFKSDPKTAADLLLTAEENLAKAKRVEDGCIGTSKVVV